jgi:hypothetical protein
LLESPKVEEYITAYHQDGDNMITRKSPKKTVKLLVQIIREDVSGSMTDNTSIRFLSSPGNSISEDINPPKNEWKTGIAEH